MAEDVRDLPAVRLQEGVIVEDGAGGADRHDGAGVQHDHPGADLDDEFEIVGGGDLRAGERAEDVAEGAAALRVERGTPIVEARRPRVAASGDEDVR